MSSSLNRFLHGTLWKWVSNELALIISNDEYNSQNPVVNCVSVTGVLEDSISIDNIQCNQIHTVKKEVLHEFIGAVPAPILAIVKANLQKQFNIGDDKNLQAIQETASKLIGQLAQIDSEYVPSTPTVTPAIVASIAPTPEPMPSPTILPVNMKVDAVTKKGTDTTPSNTISPSKSKVKVPSAIKDNKVKPTKKTEPSPKSYGKKSLPPKKSTASSSKPKRDMYNYTDEDEMFVLDGNPTTQEVMDRFGFTEKRKVYDIKLMLKKRREKRQNSK